MYNVVVKNLKVQVQCYNQLDISKNNSVIRKKLKVKVIKRNENRMNESRCYFLHLNTT